MQHIKTTLLKNELSKTGTAALTEEFQGIFNILETKDLFNGFLIVISLCTNWKTWLVNMLQKHFIKLKINQLIGPAKLLLIIFICLEKETTLLILDVIMNRWQLSSYQIKYHFVRIMNKAEEKVRVELPNLNTSIKNV